MPPEPSDATFRYDPELAPGYFVLAATVFLRAPNVSALAKVLYLVLCSYAGTGDVAWPGQERLCGECGGVSPNTLRKALAELETLALLDVERRGLTLTNRYWLHKLPTRAPDTQNLRIKKRSPRAPKGAAVPPKVDSREIESGEKGSPQMQFSPPPPAGHASWEAYNVWYAEQQRR